HRRLHARRRHRRRQRRRHAGRVRRGPRHHEAHLDRLSRGRPMTHRTHERPTRLIPSRIHWSLALSAMATLAACSGAHSLPAAADEGESTMVVAGGDGVDGGSADQQAMTTAMADAGVCRAIPDGATVGYEVGNTIGGLVLKDCDGNDVSLANFCDNGMW